MDMYQYEDLSKRLDKITDALEKLVAFQMLSYDDTILTRGAKPGESGQALNMLAIKRAEAHKKLFGDDSE